MSTPWFDAPAPLLPEIRDQLGVAEGYLGLLITSYAVGVGVFSLISGWGSTAMKSPTPRS